ncbi:TetR/AcrR family transcriptional regulator [Litoribacter ruber]|uniref:TetR/AcrR family transcriptional regulator n=1 Tax=Litoribacter ruber TaxID=702568 RepID=A0AAP2CFU0_9BACT|nr:MULTISPECIES: TetR/AcrR family transcriptional regulator [Litoribacter]MBS9522985.1 TetR/AcrR family transcriptional regulator [Litoribacter alkaliphilus]MBT0810851.1 TetR/AcrR family transcriptional regulator [Litoribacter ruber]
METREKIIEITTERIARFGVRSVTMDDIARAAGVSKKTIYQEFGDKEQLVYDVFTSELDRDAEMVEGFFKEPGGVIGHLIKLSKFIRDTFTNMHPMVLNEIQRYYPRCWQQFEKFKEEHAIQSIIKLLEEGKQEGIFRKEIDSEILAQLRMEQITLSFDPMKFPPDRFNLLNVQMQLFDLFLYGILTEKGVKIYHEKMKHQDLEL